MEKIEAFATKLPIDIIKSLDLICKKSGISKKFIVESALREKIEDLLDKYDLENAISESTGFHSWEAMKQELKKKGK